MTDNLHARNAMKTGWPPGLLQDDSCELSRWFANRLDARQVLRKVADDIAALAARSQEGA